MVVVGNTVPSMGQWTHLGSLHPSHTGLGILQHTMNGPASRIPLSQGGDHRGEKQQSRWAYGLLRFALAPSGRNTLSYDP